MKKSIVLLGAFLALNSPGIAQGYHVLNTYHILSPGRWDYIALSPVNDNVYVSHTSQVNILNRNTGDSVGVIPNIEGVHGIAFAPQYGKGFTSNGRANTVTVFDINTNKTLGTIKTGENPDAIMYDPYSKKVYVCDGRSKDLCIIDPADSKVVKTIDLGGAPETAVSDETGRLYIDIEDKNEVVVVNTKTYAVMHRWKLGKGEEPAGLAIDIKAKRLFAGCGNKQLVVLNAENGLVVKELPIGDGCDGVVFDAGLKHIIASNGDGTLTVIKETSANSYSVVENATTKRGARTLALDAKTHKVYLPTAEFSATKQPGQRRPDMLPGSFQVLVVGR